MSQARVLSNSAHEQLEWASLEALDVRFLRRPLACSWKSVSTSNTTTAVELSLSLYKKARRASSSFKLSLLMFSLSFFVFVSKRFSTLPALCLRLCRHLASRLWRRSALSAIVFGLCSALLWALLFWFCSASRIDVAYSAFASSFAFGSTLHCLTVSYSYIFIYFVINILKKLI